MGIMSPVLREVVAQMRYVICVRDPAEVASSLAHYRGHDGLAARANALWLESTARSLVETNGHGRLLVTYDSWFDEPEREALRLAEFVGRPLGPDVLAAIHDFVDADLRHHGVPTRVPLRPLGGSRRTSGSSTPFCAILTREKASRSCFRGTAGREGSSGSRDGAQTPAAVLAAALEAGARAASGRSRRRGSP